MNIGDGLTIQTRTINGKTTTGVFLNQTGSVKNTKEKFGYKSKTVKYPLRSRSEQTQPIVQDISKVQRSIKGKSHLSEGQTVKGQSVKGQVPQNTQRSKNDKPARTVSATSSRKSNPSDESESNNKNETQKTNANQAPQKASQNVRKIEKNKSVTTLQNRRKTTKDTAVKGQGVSENVNTKFVTLTQDQLNTILSLVKTKHDIDVSEVLHEENDEKKDASSSGDESKDGDSVVEPKSVPGLDLEEKVSSKPSTPRDREGKKREPKKNNAKGKMQAEDQKKQETTDEGKDEEIDKSSETAPEKKLFGYDLAGALGGLGSREKDKAKLEADKQQWIKELREQVEKSEKKKEEQKQKRRSRNSQETTSIKVVETEGRGDGANSDKENAENKPTEKAPSSARSTKRSERKEEHLPTRRSQEDMPAAIRSSFFIGEAAPRDHAFSAKKKQENQRWREQLDLQCKEQLEKKEKERKKFAYDNDDTLWSRHFDTMQPNKKSADPNTDIVAASQSPVPSQFESSILPAAVSSDSVKSISDSHMDRILTQNETNPLRESAMNNIFRGGHTTAAPGGDLPKSNYLRTMTALLDPAQLEALEVRRRKQDEHRRAIEAQVEERKRKKEEQQNLQKRLEMEEDLRLAADRDRLLQKTEMEKMKTQMQENLREQQTQQLYHQMQEAQESALRDKLVKRQQLLKNKGHDTSRLERTHQMTLETSKKLTASTSSISQPSLTTMNGLSIVNPVPKLAISQPAFHTSFDNNSPRVGVLDQGTPLSVTANTEQGPIKLEISLNSRQSRNEVAEMGVQTDNKTKRTENHLQTVSEFNSDAETEYLPLPQPRNRKVKERKGNENRIDPKDAKRSLQKYKQSLGKQYNQYSRSERNQEGDTVEMGNVRRKKDGVKPKWGVGNQYKYYVPASKRYLNNAKWQRKHEANIKQREEQLLEQQAMNDPERLREIIANRRHDQEEDGSNPGRHSPPVPAVRRQIEDKPKRTRGTRSQTPPRERRSRSPPGAAARKKYNEHVTKPGHRRNWRPDSGIAATTEQAKYRENKHSRDSPIPKTKDFVEYRRTTDVLDPNQPLSRPETASQGDMGFVPVQHRSTNDSKDPLLNPDLVKQRQRQEQILREISILRQGLLLKQREVASYPAAMTQSMAVAPPTGMAHTSLLLAGGGNLPERTNDTP